MAFVSTWKVLRHCSWQAQYFRRVVLRPFAKCIVRAAPTSNCVAGAVFGEVSNGAEFIFAWKAQGLVELQG